MWVESTIAMRFLREGRTQTTLILVGIAVGVSVIVFITALIQGLQSNIVERTLGTQSHIKVEAPDEVNRLVPLPADTTQLVLETRRAQRLRSINNWQQVMTTLDAFPGVKAVSPVVSGPAFARRGNAVESVALVGMDPARYQRIIPIGEDIVAGSQYCSASPLAQPVRSGACSGRHISATARRAVIVDRSVDRRISCSRPRRR